MCVCGGGRGAVVKFLLFVCLFFSNLVNYTKCTILELWTKRFFSSICVLLFPKDRHHCKIFYPVPKIDKTHYYSSNAIFISQKDVNFVPCKP